jgi:hypothetical protein
MKTWIKVARFQLADQTSFTALPWGVLAINLAIWYVIAGSFGGGGVRVQSYNVCVIYVVFLIVGMLSTFRSLPFALALGVSRRAYYIGTALLVIGLSAINGLVLALLQVLEGVSDGWGVGLHFFRVGYILSGPWYLTWLTSFVGLALVFLYGMLYGLVYRRWTLLGLGAFACAQVAAALAVVLVISHARAWTSVGHFFTGISAAGLTGLLAALTVVLLAAGFATARRVTV